MILTFAILKLIKRDTYFFKEKNQTHSVLTWSIILSSQIAMTLTNTTVSLTNYFSYSYFYCANILCKLQVTRIILTS